MEENIVKIDLVEFVHSGETYAAREIEVGVPKQIPEGYIIFGGAYQHPEFHEAMFAVGIYPTNPFDHWPTKEEYDNDLMLLSIAENDYLTYDALVKPYIIFKKIPTKK